MAVRGGQGAAALFPRRRPGSLGTRNWAQEKVRTAPIPIATLGAQDGTLTDNN